MPVFDIIFKLLKKRSNYRNEEEENHVFLAYSKEENKAYLCLADSFAQKERIQINSLIDEKCYSLLIQLCEDKKNDRPPMSINRAIECYDPNTTAGNIRNKVSTILNAKIKEAITDLLRKPRENKNSDGFDTDSIEVKCIPVSVSLKTGKCFLNGFKLHEEGIPSSLCEEEGPLSTVKILRKKSAQLLLEYVNPHILFTQPSDLKQISYDVLLFPKIKEGTSKPSMTLKEYVFNCIARNSLDNTFLSSLEGGAGKTTSMIWTVKELLEKTSLQYNNQAIIPFFIPGKMLFLNDEKKKTAIVEYAKKKLGDEDFSRIDIDYPKIHYFVFVDALNECSCRDSVEDEILRLKNDYPNNITFIVSWKGLSSYGQNFKQVSLLPLDYDNSIIDRLLGITKSLPAATYKLLQSPFYLKMAKELASKEDYASISDAYTLIDKYIGAHVLSYAKIPKEKTESVRRLISSLPNTCFQMMGNKQMAFSTNNQAIDIVSLIDTGLVSKDDVLQQASFTHDLYFYYFCTKRLVNLYERANDCNDDECKKKLADNLEKDLPPEIINMFANKLGEQGLKTLVKLFSNDCYYQRNSLHRTIISLFFALDNKIDGVDFSRWYMWFSDYTRFSSLTNCKFSSCDVNPETLWLHDSNVFYDEEHSRSGNWRNLAYVSDQKGIEFYCLFGKKRDYKIYLHLQNESTCCEYLKDIVIRSDYMLIQTATKIYIFPIDMVRDELAENTMSKVTALNSLPLDSIEIKDTAAPLDSVFMIDNEFHVLYNPSSQELTCHTNSKTTISLPPHTSVKAVVKHNKNLLLVLYSSAEESIEVCLATKENNCYSAKPNCSIDWDEPLALFLLSEVSRTLPMSESRLYISSILASLPQDIKLRLPRSLQNSKILSIRCFYGNGQSPIYHLLYAAGNELYLASCNEGEWNYQYLGILQNAEELISSDINWNGYSLLRYRNFIRIADNQGRWNTIYATTTNAYFSDYDVLRVFLDSPGICREVTPEGELCWQKTTAFIKPEFFARTDNSIIIRTSIPGQQRVLFFEKKNSEEVFHLLDETSTANNLPHDSNGNSIPEEVLVRGKSASSFYEGKDRLGYKYNRQKDGTLLVVSPDNKQQEMIYGSACVFNGTVFSEISLAGVPLKNTPHIPAIQQYGGIVKEDLPDDRN